MSIKWSNRWTLKEVDTLKNYVRAKQGLDEIIPALPHRSRSAIRHKIERLDLFPEHLTTPKILFLDIETAGVNGLRSDLGFVILVGYKWSYEKDAKVIQISAKDLLEFNDKNILKIASKVWLDADVIVTHYGSVFDRRFIQGRLLIHDLPPIPPTKMRDTCMIMRSVANYSSNRLKHLAKILGFKNQKLENSWPQAWLKVMAGDIRALNDLAVYCIGDVLALEELYYKLRPFDNSHPRIVDDRTKCSVCAGDIHYRGTVPVGVKR